MEGRPAVTDEHHEISRFWIGVVVLAVVSFLGIGFAVGRGCAPSPVTPQPVGVDAGPGDEAISDRLTADQHRENLRIMALESEYRREMEQFDSAHKREYYEVRAQGRAATAAWLNDFARELKRDAG